MSAECLFLDPIGDIAVLGPPDDQTLYNEWEAYTALMEAADPLPIADAPMSGPAWLLSLGGQWFRCNVQHNGGALWISDASERIVGGMSGSPILAEDGSAIGALCTGSCTVELSLRPLPTRARPRAVLTHALSITCRHGSCPRNGHESTPIALAATRVGHEGRAFSATAADEV